MKSAYFDEFAGVYDDLAPDVYYLEAAVEDTARSYAGRRDWMRILDLGGGVGRSVPAFRRHFPGAHLTLVDVSALSLETACRRYPEIWAIPYDGGRLPFEGGAFDLVFAAGLFHHVERWQHLGLVREMRRVLVPGGLAAVFEHNPINPVTQAVVRRCAFDAEAQLVPSRLMRSVFLAAGFVAPTRRYRRFVPSPLRALSPVERYLEWCPLGAQYSVMATR